jgi:hypothetical protein
MIDFSIVGDMNRVEIILLLKKLAYHDKEDEFTPLKIQNETKTT